MTQSGHQESFEFDQTRLGYQRHDGLPQTPRKTKNSSFWNYTCRFSSRLRISPNRRGPWWNMLTAKLNQSVFFGYSPHKRTQY